MRARSSLTAELVCVLRALGHEDPVAWHLLSPTMRALHRTWRLLDRVGAPIDTLTLGIRAAVLARHAFIDAALGAALDAGMPQVVLLGAGLDARPWRFEDRLASARLFVVDHPGTAAAREKRARKLPVAPGTAVAVDFAHETVGPALISAGFDLTRRAFFIWEGVSMYLPPEPAGDFLEQLRALAAPGSMLAMDFWSPTQGRGLHALTERATEALLAAVGEPLGLALDTAGAERFLSAHGWRATRLTTSAEEAERRRDTRAFAGILLTLAAPEDGT